MSLKRTLDRMSILAFQDRRRRRQRLRNASPQEQRLWKEVLRKYPVLFVRKYSLIARRNLPVDFYSRELRMVIQVESDAESRGELSLHESNTRTFINNLGMLALYISESEIDGDIEAVRSFIDLEVQKRKEWLAQKKREETKASGING